MKLTSTDTPKTFTLTKEMSANWYATILCGSTRALRAVMLSAYATRFPVYVAEARLYAEGVRALLLSAVRSLNTTATHPLKRKSLRRRGRRTAAKQPHPNTETTPMSLTKPDLVIECAEINPDFLTDMRQPGEVVRFIGDSIDFASYGDSSVDTVGKWCDKHCDRRDVRSSKLLKDWVYDGRSPHIYENRVVLTVKYR